MGGFVGEAVSTPGLQAGTLLTSLFFMFMQDWKLGLAAVALYPLQVWLIPKLQRQVNLLGKERVRQVRRNAEKISEVAAGARDIRANDATVYERARFSEQLGTVFWIRFDIYKKKFLIKFINNFISQLGPFFFYAIGGYLVLQGQMTIGALTAVVGAQKDIVSPWRELLGYYQILYDVKIKYEQTVTQFVPPGPAATSGCRPTSPRHRAALQGELGPPTCRCIGEGGETILDGLSFPLKLPSHIAIIGPAGSGKEELTLVLAGLLEPTGGRVTHRRRRPRQSARGRARPPDRLCRQPDHDLRRHDRGQSALWPEIPAAAAASRRRRCAVALRARDARGQAVGQQPARSAGGLGRLRRGRHRAGRGAGYLPSSGCSSWCGSMATCSAWACAAPSRPAPISSSRTGCSRPGAPCSERLAASAELSRLVEPFDPSAYNSNASLAENLLFGSPVGKVFDPDAIADQHYVRETLEATGLLDDLFQVGFRLAQTMLELFADLPPDHEYFRQFSFIAPEDLPVYRNLLSRADPARLDSLSKDDQRLLLAPTFKLINARHRLGLITPELTDKVLAARRYFREHLPENYADAIAFFDPAEYNEAITIQENVIFGKIAYGQAQAPQRIAELITELLDQLGLRTGVMAVGSRFAGRDRRRPPVVRAAAEARARPRHHETTRHAGPLRSARAARPARAGRVARRAAGRSRRADA